MKEFLSDAWFEDVISRSRSVTGLPADLSLTITQTVQGETEHAWHIAISGGAVQIRLGHLPNADVSLSTDHETAHGIHDGTVSAQRAFLDGKLRIGGDMNQLMQCREALVAIVSLLGPT